MSLSRQPKKARVTSLRAKDAWWYDNRGSIEVLIQPLEGNAISCRIQRKELVKYLKRSAP